MKKRCLFLLLVCISIFALGTIEAFAETYGHLEYTINGSEIAITACNKSAVDVEIPSAINGMSVTSISEGAFRNCNYLKTITIPDSIAYIGSQAFYGCSSLASVNITDLTAWCKIEFYDKTANPLWEAQNLRLDGEIVDDLIIPDGIISVGKYTFCNAKRVESVTFPATVTAIGEDAFYGCSNIERINVATIESWCNLAYSFAAYDLYIGEEILTDLTIPASVTSICANAFTGCKSLTSVFIPGNVIDIGKEAFYNCKALTNITISEGVKIIGKSAFGKCTSMTDLHIPSSVTRIGEGAFAFIGSSVDQTRVYVDSLSAYLNCRYDSGDANPIGDEQTVLYVNGVLLTGDITIPDDVKSIPVRAFSLNGITSVTIPSSVQSIGDFAFYECSDLNNITIPNSVMTIGEEAFMDCKKLTSIKIPNSVVYIGNNAFRGAGLTSVEIPDSIVSIEDGTFAGCKNLKYAVIPDSVTEIGTSAFSGCSSLSNINLPDGIACIHSFSFERCTSLTNIEIPNSVTSISTYAFRECGLENIIIPSSVTSIGCYAFYECNNLKSAIIGDAETEAFGVIDYRAFSVCEKLENVVVYSIYRIKERSFSDCSNLVNVTLGDGVRSVGNYAFADCSKLEIINLGSGARYFGNGAFFNSENLKQVNITDITGWCKSTFEDYSNPLYYAKKLYIDGELLENLVIPTGLTKIQDCAFQHCSSLKSVTIPDGVTSIGRSAFDGCSGLLDITIPSSVSCFESYAFYNCDNLATVYYSGTLVQWYKIQGNTLKYVELKIIGSRIKGQVTSYNPQVETVIQLMQDGTEKYRTTIAAETSGSGQKTQTFSIAEVAAGTYDLVVSKAGHLTYTIKDVVVGTEDLDLTANANAAISTITLVAGDMNDDGMVNNSDLLIFRAQFGKTDTNIENALADINGDSSVNNSDLLIFRSAFGKSADACSVNFSSES